MLTAIAAVLQLKFIGDLVFVHDERGFWRLARVEDTIVGRDGQIREAKLKESARGDQFATTIITFVYIPYCRHGGENEQQMIDSPNRTETEREPDTLPVRRSSRLAS